MLSKRDWKYHPTCQNTQTWSLLFADDEQDASSMGAMWRRAHPDDNLKGRHPNAWEAIREAKTWFSGRDQRPLPVVCGCACASVTREIEWAETSANDESRFEALSKEVCTVEHQRHHLRPGREVLTTVITRHVFQESRGTIVKIGCIKNNK